MTRIEKICKENKTVLTSGIISTFIFLLLVTVMCNFQRHTLINSHKESLHILALEKANQVNAFLEMQKEKLLLIASLDDFKNAALYPKDIKKIKIAKDKINDLKNIIPGISIMNSNGVVSIGDIDLPGTDYSQHPYFLAKRQDVLFTRYFDPLRKNNYYAVIGPIYDIADKNKIIGRIAYDIELNKISSIMKELLDEKTEVYFVDHEGIILSTSEYIPTDKDLSSSIKKAGGNAAEECLEDLNIYDRGDYIEPHVENVPRYLNYRDNDVFGTHAYVPNISGCIISEQNTDIVLKFSILDYLKNIFNPFIE